MVILKSTDNRFIGEHIQDVNRGDSLYLDDFVFEVQDKRLLETGLWLLSNPNYQLVCED